MKSIKESISNNMMPTIQINLFILHNLLTLIFEDKMSVREISFSDHIAFYYFLITIFKDAKTEPLFTYI